jgi:hypothetical protein
MLLTVKYHPSAAGIFLNSFIEGEGSGLLPYIDRRIISTFLRSNPVFTR